MLFILSFFIVLPRPKLTNLIAFYALHSKSAIKQLKNRPPLENKVLAPPTFRHKPKSYLLLVILVTRTQVFIFFLLFLFYRLTPNFLFHRRRGKPPTPFSMGSSNAVQVAAIESTPTDKALSVLRDKLEVFIYFTCIFICTPTSQGVNFTNKPNNFVLVSYYSIPKIPAEITLQADGWFQRSFFHEARLLTCIALLLVWGTVYSCVSCPSKSLPIFFYLSTTPQVLGSL